MKTTIPKRALAKVEPFLAAMSFVSDIIEQRNEAISKMERMKKWELRPHSRKATGLPCPRIEFEHVPSESGWGVRWCMYWLVLELGAADIRAEDDKGKNGVCRERYVPMGETVTEGGDRRPVWEGRVETPFRDGSHAHWDKQSLGLPNLPIYARCENYVTLIEEKPKHD